MLCRPELRRPEQHNLYVRTGRGGSMQRREALKLLLAGGVLPGLRTDLFGFFRDAHPASGYALRTLDPNQNDMVVAMTDHIIPATDTPGARAARVNEFIDVILSEWATALVRQKFLCSVADVVQRSIDDF